MLISAAVSFCLALKELKLLILRPTKHTNVLIFYRVMSVSDEKTRFRAIRVRRLSSLDILRRRGRCPGPLYLTFSESVLQKKGRDVPPRSM